MALEERGKVFSLVHEINQWVLQVSGNLEDLAEFIINRLLNMFPFEAGWLLLMEGRQLVVVAADPQHQQDKERKLRLDNSVTGYVATDPNRGALRIRDINESEFRHLYQPVAGGGMVSILTAPLYIGGRCIGVLNLESSQPGAFTEHHEELITIFAEHLAVAIESLRSGQDTQLLSKIAGDVSASLDIGETEQTILDQVLERVGATVGQILLIEGNYLSIFGSATGEDPLSVRPRINDCASGLAILPADDPGRKDLEEQGIIRICGKSVIIPEVDRVPRYKSFTGPYPRRVHSELAIPLILEGEVIGVFNLESHLPNAFSKETEERLLTFVQEQIPEISDALQFKRTADLGQILKRGLAVADALYGQLLSLKGDHLIIEHTSGDEPIGTMIKIEELDSGSWAPITGRAAKERRVVNVPDVQADPGYRRFLGEGMKSELVVPLSAHGEVIGVLNLESSIPDYFTDEHAKFLERVASYAAVALLNARTAEKERKAAVFERTGEMVHRLNNRLGPISARIEIIRITRRQLLESDPDLERGLDEIKQQVNRVLEEVRKARDADDEPVTPMVIASVVDEALEQAKDSLHEKIKLNRDRQAELALPRVRATSMLRDVLFNVIDNAIRYMTPQGGLLEIRTSTEASNADDQTTWVDVFICDTGKGIPRHMWEKIFTGFSEQAGGSHGLGLMWSRVVVARCGGNLEVYDSELDKGACFRIRLPAVV